MKKSLLLLYLFLIVLLLAGCGCKHANTTLQNAAAPSCLTDGYSGDEICTDCQKVLQKGKVLPATGHSAVSEVDALSPTCTEAGYTGDTVCSVCHALITSGETLAPTGHVPGAAQAAQEATCVSSGVSGRILCTVCGECLSEGEVIPALPHQIRLEGYVAPTCTQTGLSGDAFCTVCGLLVTPSEELSVASHTYENHVCIFCGQPEAGLYGEGELLYTWQELLDAGLVVTKTKGGKLCLQNVSVNLTGTLVVDPSVNYVNDIAFSPYPTSSRLSEIYLPDSITDIEGESFAGMELLTTLRLPKNLQILPNGLFAGCTGLERVELPEGLTKIGSSAFRGCTSLSELILPSTLQKIGESAFSGCTSLTELQIPEGVVRIDEYAFEKSGIRELVFPSTLTTWGGRGDHPNLETLDLSKSQVSRIDYHYAICQYQNPKLTTVNFPQGMTELCGLCYNTLFTELRLPTGFTTLGFSGFCNKPTNINTVYWPVSFMDESNLLGQLDLVTIFYEGTEKQWNAMCQTFGKSFSNVNLIFNASCDFR